MSDLDLGHDAVSENYEVRNKWRAQAKPMGYRLAVIDTTQHVRSGVHIGLYPVSCPEKIVEPTFELLRSLAMVEDVDRWVQYFNGLNDFPSVSIVQGGPWRGPLELHIDVPFYRLRGCEDQVFQILSRLLDCVNEKYLSVLQGEADVKFMNDLSDPDNDYARIDDVFNLEGSQK